MGKFPTIYIGDCNGANQAIYVRLEEDSYFGGKVDPLVPFDQGPHVWRTVDSMLGLIAEIAALEAQHPYRIDRSDTYGAEIKRRMNAADIARILDCKVELVTSYFRLSIEMLEHADA